MNWVRKNRWLIIALPLVAVMALSAKFMRSTEIPVRVGLVERGTITNTISTNGKIEPVQNFEARANAPSVVKRIHVKEGDTVRAGQLLVQLDDAGARAQAAKARAQLRAVESDLIAIGKGGTQEEVLQTQANLVKARAERDSAERNL